MKVLAAIIDLWSVIYTSVYESNRLTALKTLSLRIRGATSKLENEGLDTEGMIETTADLRKLILASTGVDILEADQKTFKSTYEILLQISEVWQDIDDVTRSSLLQKLAGSCYLCVQKCA